MPKQLPSFVTEPPLESDTFWLSTSPVIIGRARDAGICIDHPLVEPRHAVLVEREDGWWITSARPHVLLNGVEVSGGSQLLYSGDRLQLAGGAAIVFNDGHMVAKPAAAAAPAWAPIQGRKRRRKWHRPHFSVRAIIVTCVVLSFLVAGLGWWFWRHNRNGSQVAIGAPDPSLELTVAQLAVLDSLLSVATDHIERGNILLEYNAPQLALDEFVTGLSVISTASPDTLRKNIHVLQRLVELRASVRDVYLSHQLTAPSSIDAKRGTRALAGAGLTAALSVPQFAAAIDVLRNKFQDAFGSQLKVTGDDHPEHLSLYGPGSAIDVRTKTLTDVQVNFLVEAAHKLSIRVKDFSKDAVLQAQIQAAISVGKADRAGTGLHLHLDRFANRSDRWTVRPTSSK